MSLAIATFGSCLSRRIVEKYILANGGTYLSSVYHNRSDVFYETFISKKRPTPSIDELGTMTGCPRETIDSPEFSEINILRNQTLEHVGKHSLPHAIQFFEALESQKIDLLIMDNYVDVSFKMREGKINGKKFTFFSRLDGTKEAPLKEVDRIKPEDSARFFKKIVQYVHKVSPRTQIIFFPFPHDTYPKSSDRKRWTEIFSRKLKLPDATVVPYVPVQKKLFGKDGPSHFGGAYYMFCAGIVHRILFEKQMEKSKKGLLARCLPFLKASAHSSHPSPKTLTSPSLPSEEDNAEREPPLKKDTPTSVDGSDEPERDPNLIYQDEIVSLTQEGDARPAVFRAYLAALELIDEIHKLEHKPDYNSGKRLRMLDIGGAHGVHVRFFREQCPNLDVEILDVEKAEEPLIYEGSYLDFTPAETYDVIWSSHVVEHITNPGLVFEKMYRELNEGGWLCTTVPPLKHDMTFEHVTLWNAGLVLIHLIKAGFDCSEARIARYGYNISVLVQKKPRGDKSERECLPGVQYKGSYFNGDIHELNWTHTEAALKKEVRKVNLQTLKEELSPSCFVWVMGKNGRLRLGYFDAIRKEVYLNS